MSTSLCINLEPVPYLEWQTDVGDDLDDNGSFRGTLPEGDWEQSLRQGVLLLNGYRSPFNW